MIAKELNFLGFGRFFLNKNHQRCRAALIFSAIVGGYLDIGEVCGLDACVIRYGVDNRVLGQ